LGEQHTGNHRALMHIEPSAPRMHHLHGFLLILLYSPTHAGRMQSGRLALGAEASQVSPTCSPADHPDRRRRGNSHRLLDAPRSASSPGLPGTGLYTDLSRSPLSREYARFSATSLSSGALMALPAQISNGVELHDRTYYPLRAQYPDLPAQLICSSRVKATEA